MKTKHLILILVLVFSLSACGNTDNTEETVEVPSTYEGVAPIDAYAKGNTYAAVTITEYSNFACPACLAWSQQIFDPLMEELGDQVRLTFGHYPFTVPLHGHEANEQTALHNSAECAGEQGVFWEYHDILFDKQSTNELTQIDASVYAESAGVSDISAFESCVASEKYFDKIISHREHAQSLGVTSTPTLFINDTKFVVDQASGETVIDQLKSAIDKAQQ